MVPYQVKCKIQNIWNDKKAHLILMDGKNIKIPIKGNKTTVWNYYKEPLKRGKPIRGECTRIII